MYDTFYDVCIYGSGFTAASAAMAMLQKKYKVLLISPNGCVGSESTNSFLQELSGGISKNADRLIGILRKSGGISGNLADPGIVMLKLLNELIEADILFYSRPAGVVRDGERMKGLILAAKNGISCVQARCFLDASEELEIFQFAQPELRIVPDCENLFLFNMEFDTDDLPGKLPESDDLLMTGSAWKTERTFKIRNGNRIGLLNVLKQIRSAGKPFEDALVTRASFAGVPLAAAGISGIPELRNLLAVGEKASFSFEDHDDLIAIRMYEGEMLAEEACGILSSCPKVTVRPDEICVPAPPAELHCDVLVCGGGTAGALAAIAAGRNGADTVLWEAMDCLGGVATGGALNGYYYGLPGGLQDEVDTRVNECAKILCGRHYGTVKPRFQRFHPLAKMIVLEQMAHEAGVRCEFGQTVCGVESEKIRPPEFPVLRGTPQPQEVARVDGVHAVSADGLRCCHAKVFIDSTGDADVAVFAGAKYTMGREPDAVQHIFSIPALFLNMESEKSDAGTLVRSYWNILPYNIDAGYADACDPWDVSRARRSALLGFDWPGHKNLRIIWYSTILGARASRQITGDYKLGLGDQLRSAEFPDVVAYSASHYDNHALDYENESLNAQLWNWALDGHNEPIGCEIPYRTMLPFGIENLIIACRALSLEFDANLQFRMQRDMQRIGEAAGIAAAVAVCDNVPPRYINIRKVQERLAGTKALLEPKSNYHCNAWKPANFYPDRRIFELTAKGYVPSQELLPGGVTSYIQLENDLKSNDETLRYAAAVKLAAGAHADKANALLIDCIRSRCKKFPKNWQGKTPLWKIAISVCGANGYQEARKIVEDVLLDEDCLHDQQALILAIRTLGMIGNIHSAKIIDSTLQRGDLPHTMEFPYWCTEQTIIEDTTWKLELAGFEAMYRIGLEKQEYLEKYEHDERGYVRRAAERVRLRVYGA